MDAAHCCGSLAFGFAASPYFWSITVIFLRCFLDMFLDSLFLEFEWFGEYFLEVIGNLFCFFVETVK